MGLEKSGGELLLGTRVVRILCDDRRVAGVELDNGQRIAAPTVVSAIDARSTFEDLVGADRLPGRFLRRLRGGELSPSAACIYVGTDLDARALGAHHETVVARTWDIEQQYSSALAGRIAAAHVVIPSLTDPSLAPAGEHVVIVQAGTARESGESMRDDRSVAEDLLTLAEDVLPGLREHLTFIEPVGGDRAGSFPPVHRMGPIYGWMGTPAQTGLRRLAQTTPVSGLVLAGQWMRPGHGIILVVDSGIEAARLVTGAPAAAPPLPLGLPGVLAGGPCGWRRGLRGAVSVATRTAHWRPAGSSHRRRTTRCGCRRRRSRCNVRDRAGSVRGRTRS
ncbi:MAG TPA: FAD-dependent oxidoreductase [Acidimicrobiales bacterium]|nr:FAD-dependent oxidoreductase [Acidimicrobiales bacterium]